MRNIKLTIEYDGTNYLGWQRQPQGVTVQQVLEEALLQITGEKVTISGSGRTDSGVHALGQVANFKTESRLTLDQFQKALNSTLPDDISINSVEEAGIDFHAQYDAKSKIYVYKILNRSYRSALNRQRAWLLPYSLNIESMKEAASFLIGEHDFRAFALAGGVKTTVRRVLNVNLADTGGNIIQLEIEATGFLKGMVRLITGTLVQVGKGKITPEDFRQILASGEKTKFVFSAPPWGLFLKGVRY